MKKSGSNKPRRKKRRLQTSSSQKEAPQAKDVKRQDISLDELKAIVSRAKENALTSEDVEQLDAAVDTLAVLTRELETKGASIRRLRRLIFGPSTEKTSTVLGKQKETGASNEAEVGTDAGSPDTDESQSAGDTEVTTNAGDKDKDAAESSDEKSKPRRKGHGRNGASKYTGADKEKISHESLKHGDRCPECLKGKVYRQKEPSRLVRVTGVAPLSATVYELERLRCNLCGQIFTAKAPAGMNEEKYDTKATTMIALLKYGCGLPFNRLERLEASLGIPLPASTQWEVVAPAAEKLVPVYREHIRQAAQGKVLHNDDTTARILELEGVKNGKYFIDDEDEVDPKRTGLYTSGIVSVGDEHQIALFFTGRKHAGENLERVMKERAWELGTPVQMSDGLSTNKAGDFRTLEAECNCHARRKFVEVVNSFPDEVEYVLGQYKKVYANDKATKTAKMTDEERLTYHQKHSGPIMKALKEWLDAQIQDHKAEKNSSLGDAIEYARKHWPKLTLFLKIPGAPLDNNICERILKKPILHRKNALFFKTPNGAFVGDLFMTLIHTTELNGGNPFKYLVALLEHHKEVAGAPNQWMPWNYRETLNSLDADNKI